SHTPRAVTIAKPFAIYVKWKADRPPPQSFTCWRMANARTGTASTRWRSGITTLGRRSSCCWSTAPRKEIFRLGVDIDAGEVPQVAVPARVWRAAESLGQWTLTGCTVAPGFSFEGFELAPAGWSPLSQTQ